MSLELGTSTWFYGKGIGVEELKIIDEKGISYFELTSELPPGSRVTMPGFDSDKNLLEIRRYLKNSKLKCWSVHSVGGYAETDFSLFAGKDQDSSLQCFKKSIKLAASLGSNLVVVHPGEGPPEGTTLELKRSKRLIQCQKGLNKLAKFARDLGIRLSVENLSYSTRYNRLGITSSEILEIVSDFSPTSVGICVDVNHIFNETIDDFIRKVGKRVMTLHISDNDGAEDGHLLPMKGIINWQSLVSALKDINYSGPFMYEPSPDEFLEVKGFKEMIEVIKDSYEKLKSLWKSKRVN